jgi:hypothetical protein
LKSGQVDLRLDLLIGREKNLEPPVEPEAVNVVRADASSHVVRSVDHVHFDPRAIEVERAGEARQPCADDENVN